MTTMECAYQDVISLCRLRLPPRSMFAAWKTYEPELRGSRCLCTQNCVPNRPVPRFDIKEACVGIRIVSAVHASMGSPVVMPRKIVISLRPTGSQCFRLGQEVLRVPQISQPIFHVSPSENYQCDSQNVCWYVPQRDRHAYSPEVLLPATVRAWLLAIS